MTVYVSNERFWLSVLQHFGELDQSDDLSDLLNMCFRFTNTAKNNYPVKRTAEYFNLVNTPFFCPGPDTAVKAVVIREFSLVKLMRENYVSSYELLLSRLKIKKAFAG